MSDQKPRVRLFTEIDAVLDTRYGLLKKHFPETAASVELVPYLSRTIDAFPEVPYNVFKRIYDARGDDALEHAVLTNIHSLITTTLYGAYTDSINLPLTAKPVILLNLWPYKFNEEERKCLRDNFVCNYGVFASVVLVDMSPKQITLEYVKENVDLMMLYNAHAWLAAQNEAFLKKKLPDKKLICPALYHDRVPTKDDLDLDMSPFDNIHKVMAPMIDLQFVDVEAFSVFSNDFSQRIYNGAASTTEKAH